MAAPLSKIFGGIWASDRTSFDGETAFQNLFVTEPSPFELEIQRRLVEATRQLQTAQQQKARDPLDEALDEYDRRGMTMKEIQDVLMGRSIGQTVTTATPPKTEPPMPKLVELRPKRQIQIED